MQKLSMPDMPEQINSDGIFIRPLNESDADALVEAVHASAESLQQWMSWYHPAYGLEDARLWLAHCAQQWTSGRDREFAVVDAPSGKLIGSVGISQINTIHNFGNLAYWTVAAHCNRGAASRAARLALGFAFQDMGLTRMEVVVRTDNAASQRVAQKIGAHLEGMARHRIFFKDSPMDALMYSVVASDLE